MHCYLCSLRACFCLHLSLFLFLFSRHKALFFPQMSSFFRTNISITCFFFLIKTSSKMHVFFLYKYFRHIVFFQNVPFVFKIKKIHHSGIFNSPMCTIFFLYLQCVCSFTIDFLKSLFSPRSEIPFQIFT